MEDDLRGPIVHFDPDHGLTAMDLMNAIDLDIIPPLAPFMGK